MADDSGEYIPKTSGLHEHVNILDTGRPSIRSMLSSESTQRWVYVSGSLEANLTEFLENYDAFVRDFNTKLPESQKPAWKRCVANLEKAKELFMIGDPDYRKYYEWHLYENWDLVPYNH